jgi:PTS system nitrogen regulatory IIA component
MEQKEKIVGNVIVESNLKAESKIQAIKILIGKVFSDARYAGLSITKEQVLERVMERENTSTTGIGSGLAIPHSRIEGWNDFVLVIGIAKNGIDFESLDGQPAKIVCLMVSPSEKPYLILQTTAALISFFERHHGVEQFVKDNTGVQDIKRELSEIIMSQDHILAKDVIRPVQAKVLLNDSVESATRLMHLKHFDILPVVDDDNRFCGQISCEDIFQYGMPDFFKNLHTVSFVRHIDPFEKYFRIQSSLKVENFYRKVEPIKRDKTLLEIIFDLTVKKKSKLFVVDDEGKLIGVIDRFTIIDKILVS